MEAFDFIILGAGSIGCVLANRQSADRHYKIALIKAGVSDKSPWKYSPVGYVIKNALRDGR